MRSPCPPVSPPHFQGRGGGTDCGHVLCYGMNDKITHHFDLKNVHLSRRELINAMEDAGGMGFPAHPGRRHIGLVEHLENGYDIGRPSLRAAEQFNGGSSKQEMPAPSNSSPRANSPASAVAMRISSALSASL